MTRAPSILPGLASAPPSPAEVGRAGQRYLAGLLLAVAALCGTVAQGAQDAPDYSAAERLLFMTHQLGGLRLPVTLRYSFRKSGSLEGAFEDSVGVVLSAQGDGKCCVSRAEFLSGARRLPLPEIEGAEGNPVIMYFLERDVREMQRLTQGSQNHFRKRIRMAIYSAATVGDMRLTYRGREIDGKVVTFSPFLDDPNRPRYEKFARKQYRFMLSDAVPGGVFGIQTQIGSQSAGAAPLMAEELLVEGAQAIAVKTAP
jgi:hypothetical protein